MVANNNFGQYLAQVQAERDAVPVEEYVKDRLVSRGIFRDTPQVEDDEVDWQDYLPVPTPEELHEVYNRGFKGTVQPHNQVAVDLFGAMPSFYELFPWAKDIGKGKLCLPYLAILAFEPTYGIWEAQTRGSCVSHGTRNAGMGDYCADVLMGETQYKGRFCTENIYRMRGYNSCGANCGELCISVGPDGKGGFIVRGKYGDIDLTTFSSSTEAWAAKGSQGIPEAITVEAVKNKSIRPFRCKSPEEERDAHACGFGTNGCSGLGFSSTTDEFGFAAQRGSWAHSMARMGTNDTQWAHDKYGEMTVCTIQSWGKWNTQKGVPPGVKRMPGGAFWVSGKLFGRYSIYGFADVVGFGRKSDEYADYIKERAKTISEFTEKCYDAPETLPSQA